MPDTAPHSPPIEYDGLHRRIFWLTVVRVVLVTILMIASAAVMLRSGVEELGRVEQILYAVILGTYSLSLLYLVLLRNAGPVLNRLAYGQIFGDVVIAGSLVYLTGGSESVILFMFPLTVVSAAVLLYRRGAMLSAVVSSLALVFILAGLNEGWLPPAVPAFVRYRPWQQLAFSLFAQISAVFLTAALASWLAEQLRSTRERLKLRERDFRELQQLNESIVRSIASGLVAADRYGRITFLNRAAEEMSGLALHKVLGAPVDLQFPALEGRLTAEPRVTRFEADFSAGDGVRRRFGFAIAPLFGREGDSQGHVVAFEDLTGIRAMEEAMRRSERLAAVGAMAAGLAHELRNPLASMSGSIQLLAGSKAFDEEEQRLMGIVLREADRLNGLVSNFLLFARPSPPQLAEIDLAELIASTLFLFRNDPSRRAVQVEEQIEGELPVNGDGGQLGQVLWNLLGNAAEAMEDKGRIRLSARRAGGAAELAICDEGPGISAEDLPHIFEPFYTTKAGGTGLGLAIVHGIMQAHGGQVTVESGSRGGSTFVIRLPLRAARQEAAPAGQQAAGGRQ